MQLLAYPSNLYPQKIDFAAFLPLQAICTLARQLLLGITSFNSIFS
jgi:hypothetical protein